MNTNNWYTRTKEDDLQGLVADETTGRNVAVTYNPKDAALVAAAPELLTALENLCDLVENSQYRHDPEFNEARAAIAKAQGN